MGILKALIHLAESRGKWIFDYKIGGAIVPTYPKPVGAQPIPIAGLKPYIQAGQIIKAPPIGGITAANGDVFEYLGYQVRTLRSINRRQSAAANAPVIGDTPIASNTVLDPGFLVHLKSGVK